MTRKTARIISRFEYHAEDITKHKNYRFLSDANPKNAFNIERYVSTKLKVKPDDVVELHEVVITGDDMPDAALDDFRSPVDGNTEDDEEFEVDLEPV